MSVFKKILIAGASFGAIFSLAFATKSLYAEFIESPDAFAIMAETLNGGVNITPLWAKNNGDTSEVSYRVSFSPVISKQQGDFPLEEINTGLFILVPKNAENIRFNLIGTLKDLNSGTPTDVNFPLNICENHETCTITPLPTYEEIENNDENLQKPHVRKLIENEIKVMMNIDINEEINPKTDYRTWFRIDKYDVYHVMGQKKWSPVAFDISFSVWNTDKEQFIPIRSLLNIGCEKTENSSNIINWLTGILYDSDWMAHEMPMSCWLKFVHDNLNDMHATMPLPDDIPTEKHEKYYPNIEKGDFDEHGLYLNERGCVVTRNFEDWYKIGDDLWSSPFGDDIYQKHKFNRFMFDNVIQSEWVPRNEDLCDQAVVVIPGNNE